jgi:hypothetical protein
MRYGLQTDYSQSGRIRRRSAEVGGQEALSRLKLSERRVNAIQLFEQIESIINRRWRANPRREIANRAMGGVTFLPRLIFSRILRRTARRLSQLLGGALRTTLPG